MCEKIVYVTFVSIDIRARWSQWHSGPTDTIYYSPMYQQREDAAKFIEHVRDDYPDSNLNGNPSGKYFIQSVTIPWANAIDSSDFKALCNIMRARKPYPGPPKEK